MKTKTLIEDFEKFKKQYNVGDYDVSFEEFSRYFNVENYFMNRKIAYFEKNFNIILLQILSETMKYELQDLEYYVNSRSNNLITNSDYEILEKNKKIKKIYYETHILYKKYHLIYMQNKENSSEVIKFFYKVFKNTKNYYKMNCEILPKLIENLNIKLKEVDDDENDVSKEIESSIYH